MVGWFGGWGEAFQLFNWRSPTFQPFNLSTFKKAGVCPLCFKSAIGRRHNIAAIEVKKTKRITTVSLDKFRRKFADKLAKSYVVHTGAYSDCGDVIRLPVYMLPFELEPVRQG